MQDQRNGELADGEAGVDRVVLGLLLEDDSQRPWSVEEVARELGEPHEVRDALARLCGAGLVHRLGGFVFAARSAVQAARLVE